MKIAVVYTGIAGYMTDCWRALGALPDVELRVWLEDMKEFRFKGDREKVLRNIDINWKYTENINDSWLKAVEKEILSFLPDVIFVCGWSRILPPYVSSSTVLRHIPIVLDFDMPWEWRIRKIVAKFVLWNRLRRFSAVFVPGKSSAIYARWLGFRDNCIFKGRNCIEIEKFHIDKVIPRRGFLFVGRHGREKGLDVLRQGFDEYKKKGGKWSLKIQAYIEPECVPEIMHQYACLVLPSRREAWGVVVLEAMAAGMKTIVSDRVGARLDLPVDEIFKSGDSSALAEAMLRIEKSDEPSDNVDLSKYSTESWARRVVEICKRCRK